jgi:hypothetical protein
MEERVSRLEKTFEDWEEVLRGSVRGDPGIMQTLKQLVKDMYDETQGVTQRVARLEKEKEMHHNKFEGAKWVLKLEWSIVGGALVIFLKWFLESIIHKP